MLVQCTHLGLRLQLRVGCELMAVKASDNPFRFDVIPGVAVLAPEEDAVRFVVCRVRFVAKGDHDGSLGDVFFDFGRGTSVCLDHCVGRRVG